jgi:hypothetical protein
MSIPYLWEEDMHLIDKSKHVLIDEAILDASATHSTEGFGYFSICKRFKFPQWSPKDPDEPTNFVEKFFSNNFLEEAIVKTLEHEVHTGMSSDCWISQHTYKKRRRVSENLRSFGSGFVDLDYYKNPKLNHLDETEVIKLVLKAIDFHQIPLPSYIVSSGRGLQVKWIFTNQIPRHAYTKFAATLKCLIKEFLSEFEADIAAMMPTQLLRLVGTKNQAGGMVHIAWKNESNGNLEIYDFNNWCKSILPYTIEEFRNFKSGINLYKKWDKENERNRRKANELGHQVGMYKKNPVQNQEVNSIEIWQRRLTLIEGCISARGWYQKGIPDGHKRYKILFMAANALAWINDCHVGNSRSSAMTWSRRFIKTYSDNKSKKIIGMFDLRILNKNLYQYSEANFRKSLVDLFGENSLEKITSDAQRAPKSINVGAMGFAGMSNLSLGQYVCEKKHRQSEAAKRTNQIKSKLTESDKDLAIRLRREGRSVCGIALELNRTKGTISKWVRGVGTTQVLSCS